MRLTEEELIRELREERPEVEPEFAKALDEWAAAAFPRGGPDGGPSRRGLWSRVTEGVEGVRGRIASTPPRRLIAPLGAAATLFVVAGIAISQSGAPDDALTVAEPTEQLPPVSTTPPDVATSEDSFASPEGGGAVELDSRSGGSTGCGVADQPAGGSAELARDARLVHSTEPDEVQEVANGVNDVTNRHRGYVVNSNVESGEDSLTAGASFRLRIPAQNLQAALADLSELADVQSRHEGTKDITGRVLSAENQIERLEDA